MASNGITDQHTTDPDLLYLKESPSITLISNTELQLSRPLKPRYAAYLSGGSAPTSTASLSDCITLTSSSRDARHSAVGVIEMVSERMDRIFDPIVMERMLADQARTSGCLNAKRHELYDLVKIAKCRLRAISSALSEALECGKEIRSDIEYIERKLSVVRTMAKQEFPREFAHVALRWKQYQAPKLRPSNNRCSVTGNDWNLELTQLSTVSISLLNKPNANSPRELREKDEEEYQGKDDCEPRGELKELHLAPKFRRGHEPNVSLPRADRQQKTSLSKKRDVLQNTYHDVDGRQSPRLAEQLLPYALLAFHSDMQTNQVLLTLPKMPMNNHLTYKLLPKHAADTHERHYWPPCNAKSVLTERQGSICLLSLDPFREFKALGQWLKHHGLHRSLQIARESSARFVIKLGEELRTTTRIPDTFQLSINVMGPLARLFSIPLPEKGFLKVQDRDGKPTPISMRSSCVIDGRASGCMATSLSSKMQILEEYYQLFLSRLKERPAGGGYGSDCDRTPRNSEASQTSNSSHNSGRAKDSTATEAESERDNGDEDGGIIRRKRVKKTTDEKGAELRCPEVAAGRGYAKCLTYSTRQVHRLKSDHLIPDHRIQKALLDLGRRKKGEGEVDIWNHLFRRLNPCWNTTLPSPYYSANHQRINEWEQFLRSEAEDLNQERRRIVTSEPYPVDTITDDDRTGVLPTPIPFSAESSMLLSLFDGPKNALTNSVQMNGDTYMSSLPSTSANALPRSTSILLTPSLSSSRTSLSRMVSTAVSSLTSSSRQVSSLLEPGICRCRRHSDLCSRLKNDARPKSETCQGCQRFFAWSQKATPFIKTGGQNSQICCCEYHSTHCVLFMEEFDAGKCVCDGCKGWMSFSCRADELILPAARADEDDFSQMMNWDAAGS